MFTSSLYSKLGVTELRVETYEKIQLSDFYDTVFISIEHFGEA